MQIDLRTRVHAYPFPAPAIGFRLSGIVGLQAVLSLPHKEFLQSLTASYPQALAKMTLNMRFFKSGEYVGKCQNPVPGSFQYCCWAEDIEWGEEQVPVPGWGPG